MESDSAAAHTRPARGRCQSTIKLQGVAAMRIRTGSTENGWAAPREGLEADRLREGYARALPAPAGRCRRHPLDPKPRNLAHG
eukprot:scaffold5520_cov102-Isochrysis_galbana.AAC.1